MRQRLRRGIAAYQVPVHRDIAAHPDATHAILTLGAFAPDGAVPDFKLAEGTSERVADHLTAKDIPFVIATGYGDNVLISERLRHVPMIRKPASEASPTPGLAEACSALAKGD